MSNHQDVSTPSNLENTGISFQGAQLFTKYTKEYPDLCPKNLAKVRETFLRQFPCQEHQETTNYWNTEESETLTHSYDDDWYYIKRIENTEVIEPR